MKKKQTLINRLLYIYRYDFLSLFIVFSIVLWFFSPLLQEGHIVFSDLDFPLNSKRYLEEIIGLWNFKWNTPTMLNLPRIFAIIIPYLISAINSYDGSIFIKSFLLLNIFTSSISMYLFAKSIIRIYLGSRNTLLKLIAISIGAIFYSINPWVIFRIQHIYLLCGYSLLPLALMLFFKIFDPKFQEIIIPNYSVFRIKLYRKNVIHIGLLAITISIMSAAIHYFFYTLILIFLLWILLLTKQFLINKWAGSYLKKAILYNYILKGVVLALLTLIFCYYWFSIYFGSILIDAQSSQHNINVVDTLTLFSRYSTIDKSLLMISYWWPMFKLETLGLSFYIGGTILLVTIAIGVIFYIKKNHLLLFLFLLTSLFILFSTGTTLPYFAEVFIIVVMDVPFFGNLFRDPNKLIGIVAIGYSVFLIFGVEKIFNLPIKGINTNYLIKGLLLLIIISSYIVYMNPFRDRFINGFYHPIIVPEEYTDIQNNFLNSDKRVLHFPVSGNMLQTSTGFTTLDWNDNPDDFGEDKATADFSIYQSTKNTIFHHEGSDPATSYYFNFMQYILDRGLTQNLGNYLAPLGVDEIAYGTGFLGHGQRQQFNLDVLNFQSDLSLHYDNKYYNLFKTNNPPPVNGSIESIIYTSKGFHSLESITSIPGFSFSNMGIVYNSQRKGNPLLNIRENDIIESTTIDELILSSLPEKYYLSPAQYVRNGNPFLGWSQSAIHTSDWLWHLQSQNIKPLRFDMSFLSGIALSFSSVRLDIPVHKKNSVKGKPYIDFETFIFEGYNFTAENSSIVDIETYPLSIERDLPLVHGIISKGQNYNIWQVAKSGYIPAEAEVPYQFFLTISGKGTNKMHLKARFYDKNQQEIGTAYILTPEESVNFEYFKFYGEYITPKDTEYVRVDILSFTRPEQNTHWWIHDFSIVELSDFSKPNTITINYTPENTETVIPFVRLFYSPEGGEVDISIDNQKNRINTKKFDFSGFLWERLENYDHNGTSFPIIIENRDGFNAVNEIVLIPESQLVKEQFIVERAINESRNIISLESEYDFDYVGNIQTLRNITNLSMGRARVAFDGKLSTNIDLFRDGPYFLTFRLGGEEDFGSMQISLSSEHRDGNFNKEIKITKSNQLSPGIIIEEKESINGSYPKELSVYHSDIPNFQDLTLETQPLPKGRYKLEIDLNYTGPSLINIEDLNYFDPSQVLAPDFKVPVELDGYSDCIFITPDMVRHNIENNTLLIDYDPTCSADWFITSSQKVEVKPGDEYILTYKSKSNNLNKRHSKIIYLNSRGQVIATDFIPEVEERFKQNWNDYQYISQVPDNAKTLLFQVWARGNKEKMSFMSIKEITLYPYKKLPLLDKMYITAEPIEDVFDIPYKETVYTPQDSNTTGYNFISKYSNGQLSAFKFDISPHPIWGLNINGNEILSEANINGLRALFFTRDSGYAQVSPRLEEHYILGLYLWPIGFILVFLLYHNAERKESILIKLKRTLSKLFNK